MQYDRLLKCMLVQLFLICSLYLSAHPGGHYHEGDGTQFNTWTLKNGSSVKGNFFMGKDGFIMLEQAAGKMIKIAITDLTAQDQQLARLKIITFQQLNDQFNSTVNEPVPQKKVWSYTYLLLSVILIFSTLLIVGKIVSESPKGIRVSLPRLKMISGGLVMAKPFSRKQLNLSFILTT